MSKFTALLGAAKAIGQALKKLFKRKKKKPECTQNCPKSRKDLEDEAGVEQQTKGKTKHGELPGGVERLNKDFDSLQPSNVRTVETPRGQLRTGELPDGSTVTARPFSSDGRPTLEIRNPATGRGTEIRYNP